MSTQTRVCECKDELEEAREMWQSAGFSSSGGSEDELDQGHESSNSSRSNNQEEDLVQVDRGAGTVRAMVSSATLVFCVQQFNVDISHN